MSTPFVRIELVGQISRSQVTFESESLVIAVHGPSRRRARPSPQHPQSHRGRRSRDLVEAQEPSRCELELRAATPQRSDNPPEHLDIFEYS